MNMCTFIFINISKLQIDSMAIMEIVLVLLEIIMVTLPVMCFIGGMLSGN